MAESPRQGHSKFLIYPNASAPAGLIANVDAEFLEEYETMRLGRIKASDAAILQARGVAVGLQVVIEDNFDRIFVPGGAIDARLGTETSLPGRALHRPYPAGRSGLYVAQFIGPPKQQWIERVQSLGATITQFVPLNAALIVGDASAVARMRAERFVQFVDLYHPFLKAGRLGPDFGPRDYLVQLATGPDLAEDRSSVEAVSASLPRVLPSGPNELWLQARLSRDAALSLLDLPLVVGVFDVPAFQPSDERVATSLTRHLDSAGMPLYPTRYVKWLENACSYCGNLAGEGFKVGLADSTGLDGGKAPGAAHHADLPAARTEYGTNFDPSTNPDLIDSRGHATGVAGVIAGNPVPTASAGTGGFLYGGGVAPTAKVVMTAIAMSYPGTMYPDQPPAATFTPILESATDARSHGARIQNHSYNRYTAQNDNGGICPRYYDGEYDPTAAEFDTVVISQQMTFVVASGNVDQQMHNNAGYWYDCANPDSYDPGSGRADCRVPYIAMTLPPATAKNVISVGGAENHREPSESWICHTAEATSFDNVMKNSKQGTRIAGYIKPDLMAPSSSITSLRSTAAATASQSPGWCNFGALTPKDIVLPDQNYFVSTGTSFAAPVVSGAALLASRRYAETVRGNGAPDPSAARPSLIKAMLIAGAKSMRGGIDKRTNQVIGPIPNTQQGFGRIHLEEVLSQYPSRVYANESLSVGESGTVSTTSYTIHDPALAVKVVLVWSDPPAAADLVAPPTLLVNNLDLAVELGGTCSQRYVGNDLTVLSESRGEESAMRNCASGTLDGVNNVEYVKFYPSTVSPPPGNFTVKVTLRSGSTQAYSLVVYNAYPAGGAPSPATPPSITATAVQNGDSTWKATVSWPAVAGADRYDLFVSHDDEPFTLVPASQPGSTARDHSGLLPGRTYLYKVRAANAQGMSDFSPADPATTVSLSPIVVGTVVRAADLAALRSAINLYRAAVGLSAATFSDPVLTAGQSVVRAPHLTQLRDALADARRNLWLPSLTYTDPTITAAASQIRAIHMNELSGGVR